MPARCRLHHIVSALMVAFAIHGAAAPPDRGPDIGEFAVGAIRDLEAAVTVVKADLPQLEKINKDFGILYRLREVTIRYKEPDKFRMDNRLGTMIVNGPKRYLRVPQLGIKKRDDVGRSLSRRHSLLDLGVITTARLDQFDARFVRTETIEGRSSHMFQIELIDADESPSRAREGPASAPERCVVWVDPTWKIVIRRRRLDADGGTRATFDYRE
ncbi:MAG: hypothetical protein FJX72_14930, partial [Armatimonadetes bacterium]|nr:hypothetical protein [Armatimonadota bacterium]